MSGARLRTLRRGSKLAPHHTVIGTVDNKPGRHPVYIVWDHRSWCPMACKLFPSRERAAKEAAVLAALSHPNIVRLFGMGNEANLLLEFVDGPTLADLLDTNRTGHLSLSDALRVAIHLGAALEHTRDRGFVHLDLSPSNIIVAAGRPVLIDFGLARRLGEPRPSRVVGTSSYVSPEECLRQEVTPAADVFGLGVLLYELLTGALPFPKKRKDDDPYPQTEMQPTPLRQRRPGFPKALDDLVLSALRRDPAERPSLVALLPRLHDLIRSGSRMWPANLRL